MALVVVLVTKGSSSFTLTGSITVYDDSSYGCNLSLGYNDVHEGTRVLVYDEKEELVASSSLGDGSSSASSCEFEFTVDGIPDLDEYWIEIGDREQVHYTKSDLEERDWTIDLTLGED